MDGVPGIGEARAAARSARASGSPTSSTPRRSACTSTTATSRPLAEHIARGLYGAFIVDPAAGPRGRRRAGDGDERLRHQLRRRERGLRGQHGRLPLHAPSPIRVRRGELVRIYLVNVLEYDLINSFHLHANFFDYYPTGTSLEPTEFTDTVIQGQGQRGILELRFPHPGAYMFHAHESEFAELGWMGFFEVALMEAQAPARHRGSARRLPAWALGLAPLLVIAAAIAIVRGARRAGPRRAHRPAGRGAGDRAHRAAPGRDRAHRPQRRPGPGRGRAGRGQRRLRAVHRERRPRPSVASTRPR